MWREGRAAPGQEADTSVAWPLHEMADTRDGRYKRWPIHERRNGRLSKEG